MAHYKVAWIQSFHITQVIHTWKVSLQQVTEPQASGYHFTKSFSSVANHNEGQWGSFTLQKCIQLQVLWLIQWDLKKKKKKIFHEVIKLVYILPSCYHLAFKFRFHQNLLWSANKPQQLYDCTINRQLERWGYSSSPQAPRYKSTVYPCLSEISHRLHR